MFNGALCNVMQFSIFYKIIWENAIFITGVTKMILHLQFLESSSFRISGESYLIYYQRRKRLTLVTILQFLNACKILGVKIVKYRRFLILLKSKDFKFLEIF